MQFHPNKLVFQTTMQPIKVFEGSFNWSDVVNFWKLLKINLVQNSSPLGMYISKFTFSLNLALKKIGDRDWNLFSKHIIKVTNMKRIVWYL